MKACKIIASLLISMILISCHVQKRKYLGGYYFHSRSLSVHESESNETIIESTDPVVSNISNEKIDYLFPILQPDTSGCDTIRLINGSILSVRIQSFNPNNVMYTECRSVSHRKTVIYTKEVESIQFSDGRLIEMNSSNYNHPKKFTTACYIAIIAAALSALALIFEIWIVGFILLTIAGNFSWVGFVQMYNRDNVFGYVLMGLIWLACLVTVIVGMVNLFNGL